MNVKQQQTTTFLGLSLALLLPLLFFPFPHGSSLKAVVEPVMEYHVLSEGNGSYSTALMDRWTNKTLEGLNFLPDRGGLIQYESNLRMQDEVVAAGDTLGWIYASSLLDKIATLKGNISTLKASLEFERSGSKASEVEAARQQLAYAETRHAEQVKVLERAKELLDRNVITLQEYEIDERRERLDAIRISIAQANLGSALSGAQRAKLDVYRSQIADEEQKLNIASDVLSQMTIISPITGQLFFPLDVDSLIMVGKTDTMVAMLPIQGGDTHLLELNTDLELKGSNFEMIVAQDQIKVDNQILRAGNDQLLLLRILVDNSDNKLRSGQLLEVYVRYEKQSVFQMIMDLF